MLTIESAKQRLLILKLRLKHKFTLIEWLTLDEIREEIDFLERYVSDYLPY